MPGNVGAADGNGRPGRDHRRDLRRRRAAEQQGLQAAEPGAETRRPPGSRALALGLLQTARERPAGTEDQRLDRGVRNAELGGDLEVRKSLPLAQQDRPALLFGQPCERLPDPMELVAPSLRRRDEILSGSRSTGDSTRSRRTFERSRARHTFSAILNSHASSSSGMTPRRKPRKAFRKVVWVASSASSRDRRRRRQKR